MASFKRMIEVLSIIQRAFGPAGRAGVCVRLVCLHGAQRKVTPRAISTGHIAAVRRITSSKQWPMIPPRTNGRCGESPRIRLVAQICEAETVGLSRSLLEAPRGN